MTSPPAQCEGTRIGPSGRAALHLLACCPRMPTDVMTVLLGHRQAVTTAQLLARLRRAGLAHDQTARLGPLLGSRPVRLWTLTAAGRAFVASRGPSAHANDAFQKPYGEPERWRDPARQRDVPLLVACYRLLARVATGVGQPVCVRAWEHPWIRTMTPTDGGRRRRIRLPAAAVLQSRQGGDEHPLRLLLLPDVGTAPLASYRPALQALIDMRRTVLIEEEDEPVLIVGVATSPCSSTGRAQAWQSLLQEVARRADDRPLRARVFARETWLASNRNEDDQRLPGQVDEVFAMVARHPLMTRQQLATLLRTSTRRIARLETDLIERGWLRPVTSDTLPPSRALLTHDQVRRLGPVELTAAGRQEAARRLLVPARLARRRHGVMVSEASTRRFLRHLHHTLGANGFFVDLAAAARLVTSRGGDEALVDWRSAAACARGRFRPDGYGCYQRGPWRFGFFLEYDRGTEKPGQYAAKLATYYRYRDSGVYRRDYDGFPTLLVVTTSDAAEARFTYQAYLAQQRYGSMPLVLFLTTEGRMQVHPEGALGPIWRTAAAPWAVEPTRVCWLPRLLRQDARIP